MEVIELKSRPSDRDLRWFGWILLVFFGVLGTIAFFKFDRPPVAYGLWGAGGVLASFYFAVRPLRIPMYLGWMRLFFPLGWAVSHLVLLALYYGIVTPVAVVMRIVRYDPMKRRREPGAATYWVEHRTGGGPSRYLRQY